MTGTGTAGEFYELTLYVSGASPLSAKAIAAARLLCDEHLPDMHRLTVIDVHSETFAIYDYRLIAVPMLVRNSPLPVRQHAGDLSQVELVLTALELPGANVSTSS